MREVDPYSISGPVTCPLMGGDKCVKTGCMAWRALNYGQADEVTHCALMSAAEALVDIGADGLYTY